MAMKRRSTMRSRRRVKKRRTMNISRPRTRRVSNMLSIKRTSYIGTWTWANTTTNDFWRYENYSGSNINGFSEFAALFDEYKINAIKVTFRPSYDSVNAPTAAGAVAQPQAYAHVVVDPESTVIPSGIYSQANLNTFLENSGVKTYTLNRPFSVYFKPKCLSQVLGGGTGSKIERPGWLRTSDPTVNHRGFHMFIQQNAMLQTNTNVRLDQYVTVYAQFRNLK